MRVETQRIRNRGRGRDDPLPGLVWAVRGSAGSTPAPPRPTRPRTADRTGPVRLRAAATTFQFPLVVAPTPWLSTR